MNRAHGFLLWSVIACFVIIAGVLIWSKIYDARTHFLAGTRPQIETPKAPNPTLPPLRPSDPTRGSKNPKALVIVEFADYDCLYCRLIQPELASAIQGSKYPVKLIWRDLPIPNGRPDGVIAALAARCAGDQGKFWDLHDRLFQLQVLDLNSIKGAAQAASLNMSTFNACVTSGKYLQTIQQDVEEEKTHNITGTPTLFIGKDAVSGYLTTAEISRLIDQASRYIK